MGPRAKTTKAGKTASTNPTTKLQVPPNWPEMQPVLPSSDLAFEILLQNQILTIPQLWTSTLAKKYVTFLATLPLVTTPGKPKRGDAVRVNDRYQVDDPAFAEQLWSSTGLKDLVLNPTFADDGGTLSEEAQRDLWGGEALGLNSNVRVYRYSKGQFFDQHYDDANNVMFPSDTSPNATKGRTTWTLLLYLSSPSTGCHGGQTIFYPEPSSKREAAPAPVVAELEVGTALLHRHGKDCMLHEGREVTAGEKWVIRSDLVVKR